MKRLTTLAALALAGCATVGAAPTRTAPIVAPKYGCHAVVWRGFAAAFSGTPTEEQWYQMAYAAENVLKEDVCCLMPDDTYQTCPTELGLSYKALAEWEALRLQKQKDAKAAAPAQGETPAK